MKDVKLISSTHVAHVTVTYKSGKAKTYLPDQLQSLSDYRRNFMESEFCKWTGQGGMLVPGCNQDVQFEDEVVAEELTECPECGKPIVVELNAALRFMGMEEC